MEVKEFTKEQLSLCESMVFEYNQKIMPSGMREIGNIMKALLLTIKSQNDEIQALFSIIKAQDIRLKEIERDNR